MILLLNNLHCPCGRRKTLEELKENYGSFRAILNCKKCPIKQYKDNKETFNFSNKIEGMGKNNNNASSRCNANECCFIVIDNKTKLLFDLIVITRENFSGASGNMETEAARVFCNKHKDYINLVGVVKDGDTKLSKIFEATWQKVKILKDRNHLLKNVRKNIEENTKYRCVKKIKTTLTQWIRSKAEISWSSVELKIYI
ncbi:hypothetical protein M0812_02274 [Anaeramoeba flamelloides]|uniref:Uncharacterized protein n=1 Tax=Anaeramoeba flamelloides TaxID=1746091 RepID=A0AAV7YZB8_9EUKA|nr:hypothetical protein M0812_02274 [Anaeramoeba flamelloides]